MVDYKARAYEIKTGKMYVEKRHPRVIATSAGVFKKDEGHVSGNMWMLQDRDEYIISMHTGVTDKFGKDVYIGDLLSSGIKDIYGNDPVGIVVYKNGRVMIECLSEVDCNLCYEASLNDSWLFLMRGNWVIGNVFQHWDRIPKESIDVVKSLGYQESYSTTPLI